MSSTIPIVALLLPVLLIAVPLLILGGLILLAIYLCGKSARDHRKASQLSDEEDQLLRDITRSLDKMDQRIENIETILHGRGAAQPKEEGIERL